MLAAADLGPDEAAQIADRIRTYDPDNPGGFAVKLVRAHQKQAEAQSADAARIAALTDEKLADKRDSLTDQIRRAAVDPERVELLTAEQTLVLAECTRRGLTGRTTAPRTQRVSSPQSLSECVAQVMAPSPPPTTGSSVSDAKTPPPPTGSEPPRRGSNPALTQAFLEALRKRGVEIPL